MITDYGTDTTEELQLTPRRRFGRTRFKRFVGPQVPALPVELTGPITEGEPVTTGLRHRHAYRRALIAGDALMALIVAGAVVPAVTGASSALIVAVAPLLLIGIAQAGRLYRRDELVMKHTTLDEAPALAQSAAMFTLLLWELTALATSARVGSLDLLTIAVAALGLQAGGRVAARLLARAATPVERCVVVGSREAIETIEEKLAAAHVKAEVVATLDLDERRRTPGELVGSFWACVQRSGAHRAIIAPPPELSGEVVELVRVAKHAGVRVSLLARIMEVVGTSVELESLQGLTVLSVRRFGLSWASRTVKRTFDVLGAGLALLALSPVMLAIALAVRLDSRGPILFRQPRVGRNGRPFHMLKFRSMVDGADDIKDQLRHLNEIEGLFKLDDDPRITRVGGLLRRTCLDELPQLINVLRGEMSLVGPRPLVRDEDAKVTGVHRMRLALTPGMTGQWQILYNDRVPMREMVNLDYLYVANWTLWTDIKILIRTAAYVVGGRGR